MEAQNGTTTAALAVVEHNAGTLMRQATDVAGVCAEIVQRTAQNIQGRKYVRVEGWQSIAVAYGCVASSRAVEKVEGGIRAVGEVRRMSDGVLIATAEGFVGKDETTWYGGKDKYGKEMAARPEYAVRAMAQTRAISRACRSAFAFVVTMIDGSLSTTPAEEMEGLEIAPASQQTLNAAGTQWAAKPATPSARPAPKPTQQTTSSGVLLPNYGSLKGQPVAGQKVKDLEYYRAGCLRSLEDQSKARWHDKERALLAAIDDELSRHSGAASQNDEPPPHGDEDAQF